MKTKVRIMKYDASVQKPPFQFITLEDDIEFEDQNDNDMGVKRCDRLQRLCRDKGYFFRFYSISEAPGYRHDIIVRGEMEDTEAMNL